MRTGAWLGCALLVWVTIGCLDDRGRERAGYSPNLLPEDATIPRVEDDEVLAQRIANNDGIDAFVPLRTAFANGAEVRYWDLGTVDSASAEPIWQFRRRDRDGMPVAVDHLDLVDSAPGDSSYSPFRAIYTVFVTDLYAGERITTFQALEDAIELGLVEEPEATGTWANLPMVSADVRLARGDGGELEPSRVYYRGRVATHLELGELHPSLSGGALQRGQVAAANAYVLRRQNEPTVLEEPVWSADLNADGDTEDSNVVFASEPSADDYSSLWQQVDVIVAPDYAFGDVQGESDLFSREESGLAPIDGAFVSYEEADALLNRPIHESP